MQNNDVQWSLASHSGPADRRPMCPMQGQPFDIIFQSGRLDLTAARVGVDEGADGVGIVWIDAQWQAGVGPSDVWRANIPGSAGTRLAYVIELIDGTDRDYISASGVSDAQPAVGQWWTLDFSTLAHAPHGATPVPGGTVFRVWAPGASTAHVRGDFSNWNATPPMTRLGEDFIAFIPGASVGQEYKFVFNNTLFKPDPRARALNGSNYNSRIVDPHAFAWRNPWFTPKPPEEWVVYQLHVGTFAGRNDPAGATPTISGFRDVAARVGHLQSLGVNAVMLNPINEFPGSQSGGYNPISMFAFESTYGSPDDLRTMIDALHGVGIAVLLDTTWNHFSSSDNYLWNFDGTQIFYDTPVVNTPWGPQADVDRAPVTSYFLDSFETVLGEFKMDGYRHDAIYELVGKTQAVAGQNLIRQSQQTLRRRFPDAHVLGEIYDNSAWNTSPGGIDLDGQYHEAFKNAIYDAVEAAAAGDPNISRLAATIDGSGPWVEGTRVFNYYELHDEAWPLSGAGRTRAVRRIDTTFPHDDRFALGRTKLANGITLLAQGMPAMLMGNEWAEDASFETERLDWSKKTTNAGVLAFYRDLIGLRTTRRALFANSPARVFHTNEAGNVFAFERWGSDGRSYVVVANFSNNDFPEYILGVPRSGLWGVVINSEAAAYRGRDTGSPVGAVPVSTAARDGFAQSARLSLPAHGFLLLHHNPEYIESFDIMDRDRDGRVTVDDLHELLQRAWDVNNDSRLDVGDTNAMIHRLRRNESRTAAGSQR